MKKVELFMSWWLKKSFLVVCNSPDCAQGSLVSTGFRLRGPYQGTMGSTWDCRFSGRFTAPRLSVARRSKWRRGERVFCKEFLSHRSGRVSAIITLQTTKSNAPEATTLPNPKAQHGPKTLHNMVFGPTKLNMRVLRALGSLRF